jgi:PAT family beta-lactamase induction signal transducer AmpG
MFGFNLLATKLGRLTAFFFLYMTEGIPLGFTATAVATQMRREGLTPGQIGFFVGILYLPWSWKFLIGPVVDVVYSDRVGRRRGWIIAMQVLMSLSLVAAYPIDFSASLYLFTAVVLLINIFGAAQDVAIDALACGVLKEEERGLANGLMFAGAYTGQAVGGSLVLMIAAVTGFKPTFFFVAGCISAVTVFVALPMRESKIDDSSEKRGGSLKAIGDDIATYVHSAFWAFFGSRAATVGLIVALLPAGAYSLSLALQTNLAVELGFTDAKIAQLALASTILSAVGCVVGGYLSDILGRKRMLAAYLVGTAIPTAYLAWLMYQYDWIMPIDPTLADRPVPHDGLIQAFWLANIVFAIFQGLMYGTRTALFMDICTPEVAGTQFTAYMSCLNLVIMYSAWWQGWCIDRYGYPMTLALDASLGLICILLFPLMAVHKAETSGVAESQAD